MTKQSIRLKKVTDNPENIIELLSEYAHSEAFQARKQTIIDGPHLDPDMLFQFATDPSFQAPDECALHIGMCPVCREDYIILLRAHRELWGDDFTPVEVEQFDLLQALKDIVSSGKIRLRSFVDRVIEVIEPEPTELPGDIMTSRGFMTTGRQPTTPKRKLVRQSIETEQFFPSEVINLEIDVLKDGHLAVFTVSESGDIGLVFPQFPKADTSVSAQTTQRMNFKAPESQGLWTVKAVWTKDDPIGSKKLPLDEFWNNRVLNCLEGYVTRSDKDEWMAEILEFEVQKK